MEFDQPLMRSGSGSQNIIGFLLAIIRVLSACLTEYKILVEQLRKENLELMVRLNKVNRIFAPKNEKSEEDEDDDTKNIEKKKRGGQKGHKPTKRNIPKDLKQEEVILDFDITPCCSICDKAYKPRATFDKISHQIKIALSAVHEIVTRRSYEKDCSCLGSPKFMTAPQRDNVIKKSILRGWF